MSKRRAIAWMVAATLVGGCGDVITFSKISRDHGKIDLANGQYPEAEGAFGDAIRQNPRDYESHYYLGTLFARRQQYANALAEFHTSLDVQPLSDAGKENFQFRIGTLQALADAIAKMQDRDVSVNAVEAKASGDTSGESDYMLGRIYAGRGDADSAIVAYAKAADQAPSRFYIAKEQGLYLEKLGQKPQAELALRRAYRLYAQDIQVNDALRRLGVIPGPSLKDPGTLTKPIVPQGPLPDYLNKDRPALPAGNPPVPAPAD